MKPMYHRDRVKRVRRKIEKERARRRIERELALSGEFWRVYMAPNPIYGFALGDVKERQKEPPEPEKKKGVWEYIAWLTGGYD